MYYSWMGLSSGHGNSVVIRELSLYPQPLLAKLTVCRVFLVYISLTLLPTDALAHGRSHPWGTYQLLFLFLLLLPQLNNLSRTVSLLHTQTNSYSPNFRAWPTFRVKTVWTLVYLAILLPVILLWMTFFSLDLSE